MIYYPVLIPTLNRVEHLKRCLKSLVQNTGAENTEIYISVDYPPHERYRDGYENVKKLLNSIDLSVFKEVHIFFQKKNLGPGSNIAFLRSQIENKYDAYIISEDDNEFAPNFLQYINKGLEIYKDDPRILAVCASKDTDWETDNKNILFTKLFAAYGVGIWINKRDNEEKTGEKIILPEKLYSPKKMYRLYKQNKRLFCVYILSILSTDAGLFWKDTDTLNWCDTLHSIYMHFTDTFCIAPAISKSRTWGNDGSGVNMPKIDIDPEKDTPLDQSNDFEYNTTDDIKFIEENYNIGNACLPHSRKDVFKAVVFYVFLWFFRRNRKGAIKFLKVPRKLWKKIKNLKNQ